MFSRLEPLLRPVTRRTESADTRLAIRRDESKEQGGRKGGHGPDEYTPVPWEDVAAVSTASLKTFLQSLLLGSAAPAAQVSVPAATEAPRHTPTTLGARATSAYQTMGRAVHDRHVDADIVPPVVAPADSTMLGGDFGEVELAQVKKFVSDLIDLERRGITELTIQRSLTFLDSVAQGIAQAQAGPPPSP